ncbi:tyrosine-type recombinase/integrase [Paraburkholderia sediminicola]|uniref:tyrosine-type recombinase/integrase n=1 Tax=Paraburkholderia sediminicola TaxID=458836 RepID=UPI0038BD24E0
MAKVNFSVARVSGHTCPAGKSQSFLWDSDTPGLGLRTTAAGSKAYIFQSKLYGATVRLTIGSPDSWPIESQYQKIGGERKEVVRGARQEARRLQTLIDSGIDPREHATAQRAAHEARKAEGRRQDVTLSDAWNVYLAENQTKWSDRHYQDHKNLAHAGGAAKRRGSGVTVPGPLAALMPLKLSNLSADTVASWLEVEAKNRPTNAEQSYRKLRAFIRWCDDRPEYAHVVPPNSYNARSVRNAVPRTNAKDDCLQREQLSTWFNAVHSINSPVISIYLQGLLITGARREELAALQWTDVDFRWRALNIDDKVEQESGRTIPLTPYLASLLMELKRLNETPPNDRQLARIEARGEKWEPSPFVFASSTSASGYIAEPRIAHTQALAAADLPHLSLHGLRRSFGTLAEWCEVPVGVVAQIQGHKPSAIAEKHYRRRPLDLLRMWHDKIEAWMLEQAGIEYLADVARSDFVP